MTQSFQEAAPEFSHFELDSLFRRLGLEDREWMEEALSQRRMEGSFSSFATNFLWAEILDITVARLMGCGVLRYRYQGREFYSFPFGPGDARGVIACLMECLSATGRRLAFFPLEEWQKDLIKEWFPLEFDHFHFRSFSDYEYSRESLDSLSGKALQPKRNMVRLFMASEDWSVEQISAENLPECLQYARLWAGRQENQNQEKQEELGAVERALENFKALGLSGILLRLQGRLVAFSVGVLLNGDTMVVQIEKADRQVTGTYQTVNHQFVRTFCQNLARVNREEDMGSRGLRTAKMSYHPIRLIHKYKLVASEFVKATPVFQDQVRNLWLACFADSKAYVHFFLQRHPLEETALIRQQGGRLESMAMMLPLGMWAGEEILDGFYLYAVSTRPDMRCRGIITRLVRYLQEVYQRPLFLVAASRNLEAFYGRLGFRRVNAVIAPLIIDHETVSAMPLKEAFLEPVSAIQYKTVRDRRFQKDGFVEWSVQDVQFAMDETTRVHGQTLLVDREDILMACPQKETGRLRILETTLPEARVREIAPLLCRHFGCTGLSLIPPRAMAWIPDETGNMMPYIGLTLD